MTLSQLAMVLIAFWGGMFCETVEGRGWRFLAGGIVGAICGTIYQIWILQ